MKRVAGIVFLICSAIAACSGNDPIDGKNGRVAGPRLTGAPWQPCCRPAEVRESCSGRVTSAAEARALLLVAHGACLDTAFDAVARHAPDDLPAAYFIRAQRKDDPVDFLRALRSSSSDSDVARFNRALILEKLGLTTEAIQSWNAVILAGSPEWSDEARIRRDRLMAIVKRVENPPDLAEALRRRDRAAVRDIAGDFPSTVMRYFEPRFNLRDLETWAMLADALAETGEPYARAIVDTAMAPADPAALRQGLAAFAQKQDARAASLLEQAGNPLHLAVRLRIASVEFRTSGDPLPVLDSILPIASAKGYRDLALRAHLLRANALEQEGRYLEAFAAYEHALRFAQGEPTPTVEILARRSSNHTTLGKPDDAFRDSFGALSLLPAVMNVNARQQAFGTAAEAALKLEFPDIAFQYRDAAVATVRKGVANGRTPKHELAIALRYRADAYLTLGDNDAARVDMEEATALVDAAAPDLREPLRMRLAEVQGHQALLNGDPERAAAEFTEAIDLASKQHSTYRAVLHYKRAAARKGDPGADADVAAALQILRDEAATLRESVPRGQYERLWNPYFSRFQTMYQDMIVSRIAQGDEEGAFVYAEQARAFEPMQLLLQSAIPPGFHRIESTADLQPALKDLPQDTVILQYLVLDDRTYVFVLTGDRLEVVVQRAGRERIDDWVRRVHADVKDGLAIDGPMRAAYDELFALPLARAGTRTRIVVVPDGPMHGLPFAALQYEKDRYLIERASIAVAGSTSLYLYALHRDRQFRSVEAAHPRSISVLIVGEPATDPRFGLGALPNALAEATQLKHDYPGAELLLGPSATTRAFLNAARNAAIIHFAGHAVANGQNPWHSRLMLAPEGTDAGDLTAEKLLTTVPDLQNTRLIVLAACSTASGESVGPEGLAPLVRPLIAARVPAVVGTLWDVKDIATFKDLLVSLHRHYRDGDDVAVALRKAQLAMLREPARTWAPLQVVGYAGSPYAHHAAQQETHSEHVRTQNPLHRPDGLHPQ